jgi:uncharacterized protein YaaQ
MDTRVILAVIPEQDADSVLTTLHEQGFRVTRIASTGGFWRRGNVTLLIGVAKGQVSEAIELLRDRCSACGESRRGKGEGNGGVVFILNAEHFEQV